MRPADIPISEKIDDLSILGAIRAVANIWVSVIYILMVKKEENKQTRHLIEFVLTIFYSISLFLFWMKYIFNCKKDDSL